MPRLDLAGLAITAALGAWVWSGDGRTAPVLALLAGMVVVVAAARAAVTRGLPALGIVALAVAGTAVLTWPGMLRVTGAPLGYANANAALVGLGAVAAIGGGRRWRPLAIVLLAAVPATGSVAGTLVVLAGVALVVAALAGRWAPVAIVGGMVACSLALGVTVAIATGDDLFGLGERAAARAELWAGAEELADDEPLRGIGAGGFAEQNPVTDDADLRWAHHGPLQIAAELGIIGLVLALALAGWMWLSLLRAAASAPAAASVGAGAMTVVGLHASVDYVLHFPAVVLVAVWIFGAATAG